MQWWINWAYAHAPAFVRTAVDWIVRFVMGVAEVLTSALRGNRSSWVKLFYAILGFKGGLSAFVVGVAQTLAWLRNSWVQRVARFFVDALQRHVDWLLGIINRAFRAADALIDRAWRAATSLLQRAVSALQRWALAAVNAIWRVIPESIRRAWQLLLDPRRLAEWAAGAIWFALARLANREAERIFRWVLGQSVRFTVSLARLLEGLIVRVL